jgi:hypothetical protein
MLYAWRDYGNGAGRWHICFAEPGQPLRWFWPSSSERGGVVSRPGGFEEVANITP